MATPAASAPATVPSPFSGGSVSSASQDSDRSSEVSAWDSEELHRHAERLELEELTAMSVNPSLLPTLNDLLLEVYTLLRPKPVDYEQRSSLVDVFNKMTNEIFGNNNGFPIVQAFGSFTMDLFTPRSDLDLSVNFSADTEDKCARRKKISVIRKFAKVLYSHQRDGICCGVLPVVSARVPILNVIDRGTGIECDISVENKDAQTRHPPILPAFSALLKDGSDFASVERNILLCKGFGSRNKESVAELFVSLMSKLLSVESLWEHGLCASNFEASWISKTWKKGVGNLSVEDFLDRSQNFARSVGKVERQKICRCLRDCALNLSDFMRGKINTLKLKTLLFGRLNPDELVSKPRLKRAKRKRKSKLSPEGRSGFQKIAKHAVHHVETHRHANATIATGLPTPAPAIAMPPILHQRPTQSTKSVHKPWPLIIPSGFGYGLSVQLPVAPHLSQGLMGRPPGNLIQLNNGIQLPQQGPLLPMPYQQTFGNMFRPYSGAYNVAQKLQHNSK